MIKILFIIFLLIIIISILFYLLYKEKKNKIKILKINTNIEKENNILLQKKNVLENSIEETEKYLKKINMQVEDFKNISNQAFENFSLVLDNQYKEKELEQEEAIKLLKDSYSKIQNELNLEIENKQKDLDNISSTRAAAIKAQLRELEIKEKSDFYSLAIDEIERREIKLIQSIENELRDPRPLRMIIWNSYYSKRANDLAAKVLGDEDVSGIYKITNKNNGLCYIGKSVDVKKRWRDHMKCGLGIDTPVSNKLYIAMKKDGLESFTFELLEKCKSEELNEKEAFYIDLYNSYNYGYNSQKGNKNSNIDL